jgi:dTDP-4-dehydrorhamnose reductase
MRILVTGASGLLGINLALEAAQEGLSRRSKTGDGAHTVFGVVNRHALKTDAFTVLQADLLAPGELERTLEIAQPDWVIHCAALAIVDACEVAPELARAMNTELPGKLARLVARGGARLLHISTDSVFDGQRGSYREEDEPNPLGVYARTKLEGERTVAAENPRALIARVNMFGWSLSGSRSLAEWFFYNLQAGYRVMGFTDVYFCPLLVNDLAGILLRMLDMGLAGLYHVVSSECISKYAFGVALARRFKLDENLITPSSVQQAGLKAMRSPMLTLRSDKLSGTLGEPLPAISSGLEHFYNLYLHGYPQILREMEIREGS